MKIHTLNPAQDKYLLTKMVSHHCQVPLETVIVSEENQGKASYPILELADGTTILQSVAQAKYIANQNPTFAKSLLGATAFEQASIEQFALVAVTAIQPNASKIVSNLFGDAFEADYEQTTQKFMDQMRMLDTQLNGKLWLVGNSLTFADLATFALMHLAFSLTADPAFRKTVPNLTAWFGRVAEQSEVIKACGRVKMCGKKLAPVDVSTLPKVVPKPKPAKKPGKSNFDYNNI